MLRMPPGDGMPILRHEFSTPAGKTLSRQGSMPLPRASTSCTSTAMPVGDQQLAPGLDRLPKRIQYQTYDVTDLVRSGDNALAPSSATAGTPVGRILGPATTGTTPR